MPRSWSDALRSRALCLRTVSLLADVGHWAAAWEARLSWRVVIGLTGFIPGNSHPCSAGGINLQA